MTPALDRLDTAPYHPKESMIPGFRFDPRFLFRPLIPLLLLASSIANAQPSSSPKLAYFTDIAQKAGLSMMNVFGGVSSKKYIIETTGTGVAIFDYDNDGWPDIFFVNGTTLEGFPAGQGPTNHLYRNNHDGTFADVTVQAGLAATGWGQGVCVGDYDNDGWEDLFHRSRGAGASGRFRQSLGDGLRLCGL